jgi:putative flavoprotein involved in K+ transport
MSALHTVDTVVVGAGHAGLAVSRLLTAARREHVVLDRGRVAERWRTARWDSLRLLTPTWMTRLPGWQAAGDPDAFLSAAAFTRQLEQYAASFDAPVVTGTTVERLARGPDGMFDLHTDHATWRARSVVLATGPHGTPHVPTTVERAGLSVVTSDRYRSPDRLDRGGVLVVGASASGVQIADELARSGRDVLLAVGRHTRMPRHYRGMDVFWWLESTGRLARTIEEMPDPSAARREPSVQLVGRVADSGAESDAHSGVESAVDLAALQRRGVRLAGHLLGLEDGRAVFAPDLSALTSDADRRLHRLLDSFDRYADRAGLSREVLAPVRPVDVRTPAVPTGVDLHAEGIRTVVLATGFRPDFSWIDLPVTAADGRIRQHRGATGVPGLFVIGQRFQHRRDSAFIDGARHDAEHIVARLTTGGPATSVGLDALTREDIE